MLVFSVLLVCILSVVTMFYSLIHVKDSDSMFVVWGLSLSTCLAISLMLTIVPSP